MPVRDAKGRYVKGSTGNILGRSAKKPKPLHDVNFRQEFFDATEEILSVTINGKVEKTSAMNLIYKQMVRKAALGDVKCIMKTLDLRHQFVAEEAQRRGEMLQEYLKSWREHVANPEETSDETLRALENMRDYLKDWLHPTNWAV